MKEKKKVMPALVGEQIQRIGNFSSFVMFQFKLWPLCWRQLKTNRSDLQAAALAYNTIFGFIPLLIVMLIIFQSVPAYESIGNTIQDSIFKAVQLDEFTYSDPANPGKEIMLSDYVKDLVSGFFEKTHRGAMTIVSLLFVFWAAIKLLGTVEKAFNNIWEVKRHRPMMQKIFYYWTILTLGPLLIGAGLYLKTMKIISENLYGVMSALDHFNGWGWVFTLISFYLLFWSMPNTKVRPSAAFWGALVTTIIWTEVKRLYGYYVFEFEPFKQLYGVLALIPITILWINISWQIVLFGVHLSYIVQNFKALDVAAKVSEEKNRFYYPSPDSAFQITAFIGQIFDGGGEPVSEEQVCEKFEAPHSFVSSLLEELPGIYLLDQPTRFI